MSEDIQSGNGTIPPRLTIKVPGQTEGAEANAPAAGTSDLGNSPAPAQMAGAPLINNKKKTARISLDQATADSGAPASVAGGGIASKTIRLAPAMTGQVSAVPLPSVGKALTGILVSDEIKRKTSRISLDSVLPQLEAASVGGDAAPKTIRIKRPTFPVPSSLPSLQAEAPLAVSVESNVKSQTARVELPPEPVSVEGQQTQKKTIKIRRADGGGGGAYVKATPRSVNISRIEAEAAIPATAQVAAPHWSFVLVATAAVITLCVMLYVLMAQAFPALGWSLGG